MLERCGVTPDYFEQMAPGYEAPGRVYYKLTDGEVDAAGLESRLPIPAGTTDLDLSRNKIERIPDGAFAGLAGLVELYLDDNLLTSIAEATFAGLTALALLRLGGNLLSAVPTEALSELSASLTVLHLWGNMLTHIPDGAFAALTQLEELSLNDNDLTELRRDMLEGLFHGGECSDVQRFKCTKGYLKCSDLGPLSKTADRNLTYPPSGPAHVLHLIVKIERARGQ